jgi:uncharacterized membrane protein
MSDDSSLDSRLEALERAVSDLREQVERLQADSLRVPDEDRRRAAAPPDRPGSRPRRERPPRKERPPKRERPRIEISTEEVLKWSGILLVLISVGLLFKYAVDAGWLGPAVRVALGMAAGLILLLLGLRIHSKRPRFGQVLEGGGITAFYITLFAAFQVLDFLPYPAVFVGMVSTTIVALTLGLWQEDVGLAVFGLLGGLATPFLLYTGEGDVPALISYVCLLLSATTVIYLWKGWNSMLYATVIGGLAIFFTILIQTAHAATPFLDRLSLQLAAVFAMVAFWAAPLFRAVSRAGQSPDQEITRAVDATSTGLLKHLEWLFRNAVHLLIVSVPVCVFILSGGSWDASEFTAGTIAIALAAVMAASAVLLSSRGHGLLSYTHVISATLLGTIGLLFLLEGDVEVVALSAEMAALHFVARRLDDNWPRLGGHLLFYVVILWMLERLGSSAASPVLVNLTSLSDVVVIALVVTSSFTMKNIQVRSLYAGLAYAGLLGWFFRELSPVDNGQALVTGAWAVCGIGLVVAGLRQRQQELRMAGLATFVLVVGKLFIVDLAELDPIWRILIFLVVGAGFLVLGFFVPSLWRPIKSEQGHEVDSSGPQEDGRRPRADGPEAAGP